MPRPATRPKANEELTKVTLMLTGTELKEIDEEADRLTTSDPMGRKVTRTDVIRMLLRRGWSAKATK